jgi:hypothetical protein
MCKCGNTTTCQQECGCKFEVDAGCVRYSGPDVEHLNIVEGDTLETILKNLPEFNSTPSEFGRGVAVFIQTSEPNQTDFNNQYGEVDGFGQNFITGSNELKPGDLWILE